MTTPACRLVVVLPFASLDDAPAPPEVREIFVQEIRAAILRARLAGRIELPVAQELWRAIPSPD